MAFERHMIPIKGTCDFCSRKSEFLFLESKLLSEIKLELCSEHKSMREQMVKAK